MYDRCLVWGTGKIFCQTVKLLQSYEKEGDISVIAVTGNNAVFKNILGYRYIDRKQLVTEDYDLVIVMSERNFYSIETEAVNMGFKSEQIIKYSALSAPCFDFKRYMQIKRNVPSIFANNCWGGITYHQLGLGFYSPFINMFEQEEDYLKFLQNPRWYMEQPLVQEKTAYNDDLQIEYPVCMCGDIELYFNHYPDFHQAKECWERRKMKINWNNLFIFFYTESPENARKFDELLFEKKICFVPFESELKSIHTPAFCSKREMKAVPFYKIVNGMASGIYPYYDAIELLLAGRIRRISD